MIALLFILIVVVQLGLLFDWVLKKLGFFKSTIEQVLSNTGYTSNYYFAHLFDDMDMIAKLSKEVLRLILVHGGDHSRTGLMRSQELHWLLRDLTSYTVQHKQFFPESYKLMDEVLSK